MSVRIRSYRLFTIIIGVTALSTFLVAGVDTKPDAKDDKSRVKVKSAPEKTEPPIPVKFAFSVELREYCISSGLDTEVKATFFPPAVRSTPKPSTAKAGGTASKDTSGGCGDGKEKVGPDLDDLSALFAKATEYVVQKGDKNHLVFFCAAKECGATRKKSLVDTMQSLVKPSPRYFEDKDVPAGVSASDLAEAVGIFSMGAASGRVVASGKVRIEADKKLEPPDIDSLRKSISTATPDDLKKLEKAPSPFSAEGIQLPSFCISTTLDGPAPSAPKGKDAPMCPAPTRLVPTANAADVAAALTGDKANVIADSPSTLIVSCGAAKCDRDALQLVATGAKGLARPHPAYIEDLTVLPGTAESAAAQVSNKWSNGPITATLLSGDTIRLQSDTRAVRADIEKFKERLLDAGFGEPATLPTKQLFYADAGTMVSSLAGNPPVPSSQAAGTAAPVTGAAASGGPASAPPATVTATTGASTYGSGMMALGDSVVLSGNTNVNDSQRVRLLSLLDLPRPEVLMNVWSLQESSPDGKQLARNNETIRSMVSIHNEALQNAVEYGWAYLSRQLKDPKFQNRAFADYLTNRFVSDTESCKDNPAAAGCVSPMERTKWGLCPEDSYCLGYTEVFQPLRPTLTHILLGLMAANDPFKAVFTAIGCMEGKFELYAKECFPARDPVLAGAINPTNPEPLPEHGLSASDPVMCLKDARLSYLKAHVRKDDQPSCEDLDRAALDAQHQCHMQTTLPLSCFTIQAAKSFVPYHEFSTLTMRQLNTLAETRIADDSTSLPPAERSFSTTPLGLLRGATVNFLFNYKMAQEFPREFSPYALTHSAQELNAEFNPLVVAFNQDVAAFSRELMQGVQDKLQDSHWYTPPWDGRNKGFAADGVITVRGISGLESLVDTETQSAFSAPQYQTLPGVLSNLAGLAGAAPSGGSGSTTTTSSSTVAPVDATGSTTTTGTTTTGPTAAPAPAAASANLLSLLPAGLSKASLPLALAAAVSPTPAQAQIGRQLEIDLIPHSLPGASSTELEVKMWAQEDSPPSLFKDGGTSAQNDPISRVARHNVVTRVRVESVKLFEVSSFSAMIQRPRTKFPLLPPFVEIPGLNDLIGLPLPGAKVYHRSTAIVSAIIVPTASDLAFGLEFASDRAAVGVGETRSFRRLASLYQLPWRQQKLNQFNQAAAKCFATNVSESQECAALSFSILPPDR